jgi:membrane-bound lytic murein transglycosylase MltF
MNMKLRGYVQILKRFTCMTMVAAAMATTAQAAPLVASAERSTGDAVALIRKPWTGDFNPMAKRRLIRFLVVHSKTFFFVDQGAQRGMEYELAMEFEKYVNRKLKTGTLKVQVAFIPVTCDRLLPALLAGEGDIAAASLTIIPAREKLVDFSAPFLTGVSEIVVTGSSSPPLHGVDDLAGREVYVRRSSSYFEGLTRLNKSFRKAGKPEVKLVLVDEHLEDEDLLEMVNADIIPAVVIDSHKAEFWGQIFKGIRLYPAAAVNTGGRIAWAFRKNSPQLREMLKGFVKGHKKGTLLGNILFKKYLESATYVRNPLQDKEYQRFREAVGFFRTYADRYGFDWLVVGAQAYQESGIDQSMRSPAGAVGVMQILPSTAADPNVNIPNIEKMENNIHAGVKYMRFIVDQYFKDEPMDRLNQGLFACASYNAGPARIAKLRKKATALGLDPNQWFGNVEVAAAADIGQETVQYVRNIYKYYVVYRMLLDQKEHKEKAIGSIRGQ